jgi:methylated-DNA-[protein]-cysteine S-methyltransferase
MTEFDFALFDTAIGCCGIVWSARGVVAVRFAEAGEAATRVRIRRRYPASRETVPPADVQRAIEDIIGLLRGEARDLRYVKIDSAGVADFNRRVYDIARTIPAGSTLTYGEIAERLGDRNLARDVGQALGENPTPIIVPCHRVLAAGGKIGGFSAPGGVATKLRLLSIEGATPDVAVDAPMLFERLPLAAASRRRAPRGSS